MIDVVGYGVAGQGIEQFLDGSKREGSNRYEIFFDAAHTMIMYDFDDGTAAHDAIGIGTGGSGANIGLGNDEVLGVSGDSGSPTFLGGQIAGVHSFRTTLAGGAGDAVAGLNGSFGELSVDMLTSAYSAFIDDIIEDPEGAPTITNVTVSGSSSTHAPFSFDTVDGSGLQLKTVPVGGADTISIQFSEHVMNIAGDSLAITSLLTDAVPQLDTDGFTFDVATHTATWRFDAPFETDQYLISLADTVTDVGENALDGEWTNPFSVTTTNVLVSEFPSGNGTAGGDFNFVFTILPGDVDLTNTVGGRDILIYYRNVSGTGHSFTQADFDGDGDTDSADLAVCQANYGLDLIDLVFADFDGNGIVDSNDIAIWQSNYGTGTTHAQGDADGDGDVDGFDWMLLNRHSALEIDWAA